ncbi:hypothetical protein BCV72DRAFT_248855 [Rhizopus microsporus var. microsporus]|uniref:Uncharacterized protein n=1 Tax=Rhizopus microsporus var. microsporus TaxID=86635 RepID=A0A1X0R939_RHIZD|nr:hypothetical protein BCV72DRAFT_248855 [Rhizopus microsporus var. microsporus]
MSFSNIIARENDISIPKPIPTTERHSIGANSSNTSISHNRMIELYIEYDKEKKDIMLFNPFFTFTLFSALIINETIVKNLLRSIGNDSVALKSILDFKRPYSHISHNNDNDDDNDAYSYTSTINTAHSIEISPSIWNWCHRLWWSCFPCCMPGGCCDRARLKLNPFSRKGWQQQHY